ncbi:hypothetical protein [Larkinella soli]|uniref:hypothetical protein n=1 Tax=Larkinella soli TaxID=1770527 RepID=UPI000FFC9CB2|nr:hypothetical protein [Larkinella soli]
MEGRLSHYGALNSYYAQSNELFSKALLEKIRKLPFTRTVKIPILNKYAHTVLTVRSCSISGPDISPTLKTLSRIHVAIDMSIVPATLEDNYVTAEDVLAHQYKNARRAVLEYLDTLCAAHLDTNKDTTMTPGSYPLYDAVSGAYQLPSSKPEDFYNNLPAIMAELDFEGPYSVVASTYALADRNKLMNPGGGSIYNTKAIMQGAGIENFEWTNRIARGSNRTVYFVMPTGSVGIVNAIDYDYRTAPALGSPEYLDAWNGFDNKSDLTSWARTTDDLFEGWEWGVLQKITCANEARQMDVKLSCDFIISSGFTSTSGESPIKRFEITPA